MARTWFITGTSSGFGRLMTEQLLARGDHVAATARDLHTLDDLVALYGKRLWRASLDVTDTKAVRSVVDRAFAELGRIDVIVNNAGYGLLGAAEEVSDEQIERLLDTNLIGSIQVIRAALPHLRAQGGGRIIQVSSEGGQIVYPGFSIYHASKWGIEGFVETVALEVARFNIEVTLAEPGPTNTNFGVGLVTAPPTATYEDTPVGEVWRVFQSGDFEILGDANKMARAMIESVDRVPAPRRLVLGSRAHASISEALRERARVVEAGKELALAMDVSA